MYQKMAKKGRFQAIVMSNLTDLYVNGRFEFMGHFSKQQQSWKLITLELEGWRKRREKEEKTNGGGWTMDRYCCCDVIIIYHTS